MGKNHLETILFKVGGISGKGLFFLSKKGFWLKDSGCIKFFPRRKVCKINVGINTFSSNDLGLCVLVNGKKIGCISSRKEEGYFSYALNQDDVEEVVFQLKGVAITNFFAWLGRLTKADCLQQFRQQNKNKELVLTHLSFDDEVVFNKECFSNSEKETGKSFYKNVNLFGWYKHGFGVAKSVRLNRNAFEASDLRFKEVCLRLQDDRLPVSDLLCDYSSEIPYFINIFHIDPNTTPQVKIDYPQLFKGGYYNIIYWAWELPEIPNFFLEAARGFDEVWVPSEFVRRAMSEKLTLPVTVIPHAIDCNNRTLKDRAFGMENGIFYFLFTYDANSYSERKNPKAVIDAFKKAFQNTDHKVGLIIKVHGCSEYDLLDLDEKLSGISEYILINEMLSEEDYRLLQSSVDCFVSLHRSEGFGLNVAESMSLGIPVVCTNWSATTEFVNDRNGYLVDYELIELKENVGPYPAGGIWANPSIDSASKQMLLAYEDKCIYAKKAIAAKQTVAELFSSRRVGEMCNRRVSYIIKNYNSNRLPF